MSNIGIVISTPTSPSLEIIEIIIEKNAMHKIERGQFLCIPLTENIQIIAIVTNIRKTNAYYETFDPNVQEIASRNYEGIFPTGEWENTVAELKPLGQVEINTKAISRVKVPVSPGTRAKVASPQLLSTFLGLDDSGLYLGNLSSNNVRIKLNISKLLRKHLAILAISGAGKSYATSILLEELYNYGKLGILVIDPHGEYTQILPEIEKDPRVQIINSSFISIGVPSLTAWQLSEFMPEISIVQARVLNDVIESVKKEKNEEYALQDLIYYLDNSETINSRTKDALIGWLLSLQRTFLFSNQSNPSLDEIIEPGQITIVDLSGIQNIRSRQIITHYLIGNLYYKRMRGEIPPILFIIEEAHQFCPETSRSISKRIIETIAREGRKFYASLCLISQRPVNMSVTALSQCNSNLIMRIRNPYDQDFIGRISEGIDRSALKSLPDLEIGEALIVGEAINYPTFLKIRTRRFRSKDHLPDLEEKAAEYKERWSKNRY